MSFLPAAMLMTTILPCPLLRSCVISCHKLPAAVLMITTLPCPLLSPCVISCHELSATVLMTTTLPCPLLRSCVILCSCHEPAAVLMITTLPCPLLCMCVISCHELPAAMLMITTLPCPLLSMCVTSCHELRAIMLNDDNFTMSFSHCSNSQSLVACRQLPPMVVMMAFLCLILSLCVILQYIRCLQDAEDNSAIFRPFAGGV